jgi:signal transduction histidine kinase
MSLKSALEATIRTVSAKGVVNAVSHFLARYPTPARFAVLQTATLAACVAVCLWVASSTMRHQLKSEASSAVGEDLSVGAAAVEQGGASGFRLIQEGAVHQPYDAARLIRLNGTVVHEALPRAADLDFRWPDAAALPVLPETHGAKVIDIVAAPVPMVLGRRRLDDGSELWKARMDAVGLESLNLLDHRLLLVAIACCFLAVAPSLWLTIKVTRPVQGMIERADILAHYFDDHRLEVPEAVPELRRFAEAFNLVLDRNHQLTQELRAANDQLAHELRTPLSRVRGHLEAIANGQDTETLRNEAQGGIEDIDRASELIARLLAVRAGDHGVLKLNRERVGLHSIVGEHLEMYRDAAEERQLRLTLLPGGDGYVRLDRQYFLQALSNLLDNALAYTPAGGEVRVKLSQPGALAVITVEDTGPGLDSGELQSIWQRFVRGSVASAKAPGMGLGLSLVRAIAHAHGGSAGCANRAGGGAEFWIELPVGEHTPVPTVAG